MSLTFDKFGCVAPYWLVNKGDCCMGRVIPDAGDWPARFVAANMVFDAADLREIADFCEKEKA